MRQWTIAIVLVCGIGFCGCSKKPAPAAPAAANPTQPGASAQVTPAPAPQPIAVPATATPDQVVAVFLNALRTGDSATTESLLTEKARTELPKHQLSVDVQSSPNSSYQVQPAEVLPQNPSIAHVRSIWTEQFADGNAEPYEIIWGLRHQPEGWRLAGMAMQLIPGQQPQYLDFENPADMLKKKDEAIASLQPPATESAQQPAGVAAQQPAAVTAQQFQPASASQQPVIER
jgi:hypothetical protein